MEEKDQIVEAQVETPEKAEDQKSEEARRVLQQELEMKRQRCWQEIQNSLNKYQLEIGVNTILTSNGRVLHQLELNPRQ